MTKKGTPCKYSIKVEDTKIGHQKLTTLAREPFDLSALQTKLCDVAREFLCARWHRQRQAEQLGQQWYEAAVRNQARVLQESGVASPLVDSHTSQDHVPSASRRRLAEFNNANRPPPGRGIRQVSPVSLSDSIEPAQSANSFVTPAMLRTNNVPWQVSPARPAVLLSATNILAGFQKLMLQSLKPSVQVPSIEVDSIDCVFCLTEDEEHANDRNQGALEALIRPSLVSSDAETHSVLTSSETSPDREHVTARDSSPSDPHQSHPRQRSVESPGVSVERSGARRSARLAGVHLPRASSASTPLRRSARLNSRRT
ncbi:hypothetical protein PENANT_c101G11082 [Penicillium antarcticum]|uniref:Uncharacterized protein n=1 Tax=Penicillium antarcticum TaxID=416450 RepID=A0A1V6PLW0_9EURO|nr:hypothetical protein PENANT_c101G11082 [Penicillium antarcticum]